MPFSIQNRELTHVITVRVDTLRRRSQVIEKIVKEDGCKVSRLVAYSMAFPNLKLHNPLTRLFDVMNLF